MTIILILLIITIVILSVSYYAYSYIFKMPNKREEKLFPLPDGARTKEEQKIMTDLVTSMTTVKWEEVWITSFDGLKLHGRYFHSKDGAPLHIQFHGYKGSGLRDFCGGNRLAREAGWNTLLVTQRAHAWSEGCTISFGINERRDCLSWVEYANKRFGEDTKIFLEGASMGAATVLMASDLDLPENVIGIVADCPYSSPKEIIRKVCTDKGYPTDLFYPLIKLGAKIFGKFDLEEASPVEAVKHANVPILLIHGEEDDFVPPHMSQKIYDACQSKNRIEYFPKAAHVMSYVVDTDRYTRLMHEFVEFCLKEDKLERFS